jgi:hypothetical protein
MYLVVYPGGAFLATSLEVALGFFEGLHGKPMRASSVPGEYVYQVFPDFPGVEWSRAERAIANLRRQRPEETPSPPVFPFKVCEEWGTDD